MTFYTTVRVIWADTDAARIVWFGTYLRYLEIAEVAMFDALGTSLANVLSSHRILLPRTGLTIAYKSPARFDEVLELGLGIEGVTERRVRLVFQMRQRDSQRIVTEGSYEIACVDDATFKGRPFPEPVSALFDAVIAKS